MPRRSTHLLQNIGYAAALIARTARLPGVGGVQIDFDATLSPRAFYLNLLRAVRANPDLTVCCG